MAPRSSLTVANWIRDSAVGSLGGINKFGSQTLTLQGEGTYTGANNIVNTLADVTLNGGTLDLDDSQTGKTQTFLPWDSWQNPYVAREPSIWFHEVFRIDGAPVDPEETNLIRHITGKVKAK